MMMNSDVGSVIFTICCKVQSIITMIKEHFNIDYNEAIGLFYKSKVYRSLENKEVKMWYFSSDALFKMFLEEKETGKFYCGEILYE